MASDEKENSSSELDETTPASETRIDELVEIVLHRLRNGEPSGLDEIIQENADLQPHLERKLRVVEMIFRTISDPSSVNRLADTIESSSRKTSGNEFLRRVSRSVSRRLNCPHCGYKLLIVENQLDQITCDSCGSAVQIGPADTITDRQQLDNLPKTIGRFQIVRMLGQGGFGQVFLAKDPKLARDVAVKVPRYEYFDNTGEAQRFLREARNVSQLSHPHIVPVYEITEDEDGTPLIVSEYIDGLTLSDLASGGMLTFKKSVELLIQVAEAVDYAHKNGVVHRDLKPGNILVDSSQMAYVADFGLARRDDAEITITLAGTVLGTPAYMPPEQAAGVQDKIDARSDVYSLGVILYRLLCRELPFHGSKRMLIHQVIHDEPKNPRKLNDKIPRDLETITMKAMEKERRNRFQTAKEFGNELRRWLLGEPIDSRPIGRTVRLARWFHRKPVTAGLISTIAFLLIGIAIASSILALYEASLRHRADVSEKMSRSRLHQLFVREGIENLKSNNLIFAGLSFANALEIAQDDSTLSRVRLGMILEQLPKLTNVLVSAGKPNDIEFSPDGNRLVIGSDDGTLQVVDLVTGQTLFSNRTPDRPIRDVSIDASGQRVLSVSYGNGVHLWNIETSQLVATLKHQKKILCAEFNPSGDLIATGGRDGLAISWRGSDGMKLREFDHDGLAVATVSFVPQKNYLVTFAEKSDVSGYLGRVWNVDRGQVVSAEIPIHGFVTSIDYDKTGTRMLTGDLDGFVRIFDFETGSPIGSEAREESEILAATFVENENEVVIQAENGDTNQWNVDLSSRIATGWRQPTGAGHAAVGPNGDLLALSSQNGRVNVIWRRFLLDSFCPLPNGKTVRDMEFHPTEPIIAVASNSGLIQIWDMTSAIPDAKILQNVDNVRIARYIHNGRQVATASDNGIGHIWNVSDGKIIADLPHADVIFDLDISSDQRLIATCSLDCTVKVWDASTGKQIGQSLQHENPVYRVQFNPVKDRLVSATKNGEVFVWELASLSDSQPKHKYRFSHLESVRGLAHNADGTRLATASISNKARVWNLENGLPSTKLLSHDEDVTYCSFLPSQSNLITCCSDGFAYIWNLNTESVQQKLRHNGQVSSVSFVTLTGQIVTTDQSGNSVLWTMDDGEYRAEQIMNDQRMSTSFFARVDSTQELIANCGGQSSTQFRERFSGIVLLWERSNGLLLSPPLEHLQLVRRVFLSPNNDSLVTASADGTARIWSISEDGRSISDLIRFYQLLAQIELDEEFGMQTIGASRIEREFQLLKKKYPERFRRTQTDRERWDEYLEFLHTYTSQP